MHARSALFDVFGDHLRSRGDRAPVAALVRLLRPIGIAAPAVRTAISRMVSQGWLAPVSLAGGRGYRATPRAIRRLDESAVRIYGSEALAWDGSWQVALVGPPSQRSARERLRAELRFLGYGELAADVWIAPYPREDLERVVAAAGGRLTTATATGFSSDPTSAWDLAELADSYTAWLDGVDDLVAAHLDGGRDEDESAFAARFHLVHEWRKFLFADPGLPDELLPARWPGRPAAAAFAGEARRLKPGSDRFVARCLDGC
jgi:phenylacetic acid degradation operon negative regulatory protein